MEHRLLVPPLKQHTVSKVVLRRFALHGLISIYDRKAYRPYVNGPGGVFRMYYDQWAPSAAEKRWRAVEDEMHAVYKALDEHRALDEPHIAGTLRDLLVLHWVRSPAMRLAHEQVKEAIKAKKVAERSNQPDFLAALLMQETGLVGAGPQAREWVSERVHARAVQELDQRLFSEKVAEYFNTIRAYLARGDLHLQVGYVEPGADLLIGDTPVITLRRGSSGVGPHQGVAFLEATSLFMPVSPTVVIGMGREPAEERITSEMAHRLNEFQLRGYVRLIGCRPNGPSDRFMQHAWPARSERLKERPRIDGSTDAERLVDSASLPPVSEREHEYLTERLSTEYPKGRP